MEIELFNRYEHEALCDVHARPNAFKDAMPQTSTYAHQVLPNGEKYAACYIVILSK